MCNILRNRVRKLIAKKDIRVFKIVNKDLTSMYQNFPYKIGEAYTLETPLKTEKYGRYHKQVNEGFHSYDIMATIINRSKTFPEGVFFLMFGTEYITVPLNNDQNRYLFIECVIPKGAYYYYNGAGQYTSDQIRVDNAYTFGEFVKKQEKG